MSQSSSAQLSHEQQIAVSVVSRKHYLVLGIGVAIIVVMAMFPFFSSMAWTRRLVDLFLLIALAEMFNLLLGYGGIISVGQQGFIGIGCYSLWLFADILHVPLFLAVIFATLLGALVAIPSAGIIFKLRGGYLAIGTMVLAEAYRMIVGNLEWTGGGSGVTIQAATDIGNETRIYGTYWWALAAAAIAIAVTYYMMRSRSGLALQAMRDDDEAAPISGVNLWRTKMKVFVVAGAGCALVGAVLAISQLHIQPPSAFAINWSAYLVFMAVVGGLGTIEAR